MNPPLLLYTGNMGFCSNMLFIIHAIEYCRINNKKLHVCCDYGMHGNLEEYFEFPSTVNFIDGLPPGYSIEKGSGSDIVHPHWDSPNPTLPLFDTIQNLKISFERQREIAQSFKPKMEIHYPCDTYDAIHVRRGDALTSGEGAKYHGAKEYIEKTTCDDVFVMSDDYRVIHEIEKKVHHMIPEDEFGNWSTPNYVTDRASQTVFLLESKETKMKKTNRLIEEMYIAANSKIFVHEFSNISRFIKLIHKNPYRCVSL